MKKALLVIALAASALMSQAQTYKAIDPAEVTPKYLICNHTADSVISTVNTYLESYGQMIQLSKKKVGNLVTFEYSPSSKLIGSSSKLTVKYKLENNQVKAVELNGFIGHITNFFKGYWQTDFDYIFSKPVTLARQYGSDYIVIRTYGKDTNFARILVSDQPVKNLLSSL